MTSKRKKNILIPALIGCLTIGFGIKNIQNDHNQQINTQIEELLLDFNNQDVDSSIDPAYLTAFIQRFKPYFSNKQLRTLNSSYVNISNFELNYLSPFAEDDLGYGLFKQFLRKTEEDYLAHPIIDPSYPQKFTSYIAILRDLCEDETFFSALFNGDIATLISHLSTQTGVSSDRVKTLILLIDDYARIVKKEYLYDYTHSMDKINQTNTKKAYLEQIDKIMEELVIGRAKTSTEFKTSLAMSLLVDYQANTGIIGGINHSCLDDTGFISYNDPKYGLIDVRVTNWSDLQKCKNLQELKNAMIINLLEEDLKLKRQQPFYPEQKNVCRIDLLKYLIPSKDIQNVNIFNNENVAQQIVTLLYNNLQNYFANESDFTNFILALYTNKGLEPALKEYFTIFKYQLLADTKLDIDELALWRDFTRMIENNDVLYYYIPENLTMDDVRQMDIFDLISAGGSDANVEYSSYFGINNSNYYEYIQKLNEQILALAEYSTSMVSYIYDTGEYQHDWSNTHELSGEVKVLSKEINLAREQGDLLYFTWPDDLGETQLDNLQFVELFYNVENEVALNSIKGTIFEDTDNQKYLVCDRGQFKMFNPHLYILSSKKLGPKKTLRKQGEF